MSVPPDVPPTDVPPEPIIPPPPPQGPAAPPPPPFHEAEPPHEMPSHEQRQWAMFAHLSALLGALITGHFWGLGCFIGPLVIWLMKKDSMAFVADQAKEALNFNITVAIAGLVCVVLLFILVGFVLLPLLGIAWVVFTIIAAIKANEGELYRYPFTLRLIK